jgi:site-specific DNA recombinase
MGDYTKPPEGLPPGSIVWAYLRDSGGPGQEQSVPQQEAEIRDYCTRHELQLVEIFADVAKSGGSDVGRDEFYNLIDQAERSDQQPGGILVWNFARFARDLDDSNYYKARLRKNGIVVHSITDQIPDGPYSQVVEVIIDIANEEKRRQMSRDIKRAKRSQIQQGYATGGPAPRGYKFEYEEVSIKRDGKPRIIPRMVPDPELWDLCQLAWKMRSEGASYREIQRATHGLIYKSKNCWSTFFSNRTYLGVGKCGDLDVTEHHQAMVTEDVWAAVQELQKGSPWFGLAGHIHAPRRVSNPSLLSGLAKCKVCGAAMVVSRDRSKNYSAYICGKKMRQGSKACSNRKIHMAKADHAILETVVYRILTPEFVFRLLENLRSSITEKPELEARRKLVQTAIEENNKQMDNLVEIGERYGLDRIKDRMRIRIGERKRLAAELRSIEGELMARTVQISDEVLGFVLGAWRKKILDAQRENDLPALRKILALFVSSVELEYNGASIYYTFPFGSSPKIGDLDSGIPGPLSTSGLQSGACAGDRRPARRGGRC